MLTPPLIAALARTALANVITEYPYKLDQLLAGERDLATPRALHPLFWGSYDWHSCVHMHWTLVRLLRLSPAHELADDSRAHLQQRLTAAAAAGELATLHGPHRQTFERPYGWGWLLKLAAELEGLARDDARAVPWRDALRPLAAAFADRFLHYLPRADFAVRTGVHSNSAFALLLALDWCETVQHPALRRLIAERAQRWFGRDRRYPAAYEPGGEDFLSAGLVEAALLRRILGASGLSPCGAACLGRPGAAPDGCDFADWWQAFRPDDDGLARWLAPVPVSDPGDARIVHLHGVNLVRAWCWAQLAPDLPPELQAPVQQAIDAHRAASVPAATDGDYVGTHWLASFALLALAPS